MTWNVQDSGDVVSSTLTVNGKAAKVSGPYAASAGVNYSGVFGILSAGNYNYTITATDKVGNASQHTGSFTAAANPGPMISGVAVSQTKGKISWNAVDADGVASSTLKIDGTPVKVGGPNAAASGVNFSASYGSLAAGSHSYTITATDKAGHESTSTGSFTLSTSSSAAKNALIAAATLSALSNTAKMDWLYDFGGLLDSPQSSLEKKEATADAVDAVLA